jgi:hypothetical protein
MTTSFGAANLRYFEVLTMEEVAAPAEVVEAKPA